MSLNLKLVPYEIISSNKSQDLNINTFNSMADLLNYNEMDKFMIWYEVTSPKIRRRKKSKKLVYPQS